jgi:hypothetical protein
MDVGLLRRLIPCTAVAVTLALPVAAQGAVYTLGSDLKADATIVEDHGADSAFWNTTLESGDRTTAPAGGQVTSVKVKGTVLPDPTGRKIPMTMMHFQTLHPMPDGTVLVELSSAPFFTPLGGDQNTVSTYHPVNMCLHKGDILDFNDIGGNEWWWGNYSGMPFRTFGRVAGSSVNFYTKNEGTNIGSRWAPAENHQGEELLMQMKFATGSDATDICPGGYKQHIYEGVDLRGGQTATLRTKVGEAKVRITCPYETYGACQGVARAEAVLNGTKVLLGGGAFDTRHGYSDSLNIAISKANMRRIQRLGSVQVRLTADSHDDPAHDPRAGGRQALSPDPSDRVPVQHKTDVATITIQADAPLARKHRKHRSKRRHAHRR